MSALPPTPPNPLITHETFLQQLSKDIWVHIGGLLAMGLGAFDLFYGGEKLNLTTDLILIIGGLAAQGVKIVNGSAAAAATAAAGAIANIASVVAAQQAIAAQQAARVVVDTASAAAAARAPQLANATADPVPVIVTNSAPVPVAVVDPVLPPPPLTP